MPPLAHAPPPPPPLLPIPYLPSTPSVFMQRCTHSSLFTGMPPQWTGKTTLPLTVDVQRRLSGAAAAQQWQRCQQKSGTRKYKCSVQQQQCKLFPGAVAKSGTAARPLPCSTKGIRLFVLSMFLIFGTAHCCRITNTDLQLHLAWRLQETRKIPAEC